MVSVGAKNALFNLALALYEPGDEVIIPAPYWVSYPEQVRIAGATPVVRADDARGGLQDVARRARAALIAAHQGRHPLLAVEPDRRGVRRPTQLEAFAKVLRAHDCWIVVDEIYGELVYDGFEQRLAAHGRAGSRDRASSIVDGVCKTYAMTGWRIGWWIAPVALAKAIDMVQGQSTTTATTVAQYAALAACSPAAEVGKMRDVFEARRNRHGRGAPRDPGRALREARRRVLRVRRRASLYRQRVNGKPSRATSTSRRGCSTRRTSPWCRAVRSARRGTCDSRTR